MKSVREGKKFNFQRKGFFFIKKREIVRKGGGGRADEHSRTYIALSLTIEESVKSKHCETDEIILFQEISTR